MLSKSAGSSRTCRMSSAPSGSVSADRSLRANNNSAHAVDEWTVTSHWRLSPTEQHLTGRVPGGSQRKLVEQGTGLLVDRTSQLVSACFRPWVCWDTCLLSMAPESDAVDTCYLHARPSASSACSPSGACWPPTVMPASLANLTGPLTHRHARSTPDSR